MAAKPIESLTDPEKIAFRGHIEAETAKGADDNYVTDAEKTKLSNLSGTNTGDETAARITFLDWTGQEAAMRAKIEAVPQPIYLTTAPEDGVTDAQDGQLVRVSTVAGTGPFTDYLCRRSGDVATTLFSLFGGGGVLTTEAVLDVLGGSAPEINNRIGAEHMPHAISGVGRPNLNTTQSVGFGLIAGEILTPGNLVFTLTGPSDTLWVITIPVSAGEMNADWGQRLMDEAAGATGPYEIVFTAGESGNTLSVRRVFEGEVDAAAPTLEVALDSGATMGYPGIGNILAEPVYGEFSTLQGFYNGQYYLDTSPEGKWWRWRSYKWVVDPDLVVTGEGPPIVKVSVVYAGLWGMILEGSLDEFYGTFPPQAQVGAGLPARLIRRGTTWRVDWFDGDEGVWNQELVEITDSAKYPWSQEADWDIATITLVDDATRVVGQLYHDTQNDRWYRWSGDEWILLVARGGGYHTVSLSQTSGERTLRWSDSGSLLIGDVFGMTFTLGYNDLGVRLGRVAFHALQGLDCTINLPSNFYWNDGTPVGAITEEMGVVEFVESIVDNSPYYFAQTLQVSDPPTSNTTVENFSGTYLALNDTHMGKYLRLTNTGAITVSVNGESALLLPPTTPVGASVTFWRAGTAGAVTFQADSGALINKKAAYSLSQNEAATLISLGDGSWDLL